MYRTNGPRCARLPRKVRFPARALLRAGVLAVVLFAPAIARAGTLDQQQTVADRCALLVSLEQASAQLFTAGLTGSLDQVDLFLVGQGASADLTVQIQTVAPGFGVPSGLSLATETVAAASLPFEGGWVSIPIDPTVPVTAGTQYAIVLSSTTTVALWGGSPGNLYPGGHPAIFFLGNWQTFPGGCDLAFRTYVAVPTAVSVRSANAARTDRGVLVRWRTGSEVGLLGFHVYRERAGNRVRLTRTLIRTRGRTFGAAYSWLDRRAPRKPARYWVRAVNADGSRTWLGPLRPG